MQLRFLLTSQQRAYGAMLMKDLDDQILAFIYPSESKRTFHTFFCPPMRMVALNANGHIVFDEVVPAWRWVRLPDCQYVIECGEKVNYFPYIKTILSVCHELPQVGSLDESLSMDNLLFALLAEAVADIRRIRDVHQGEVKPEVQRKKFDVWERGQIVSSAGFLLDFSKAWSLPEGAIKFSYEVLKAEEPYLDEIVAASVAGIPWRHEFPIECMRCGKRASWRPVLRALPDTPVEVSWRYLRPENAFPICHHCAETLRLLRNEDLQFDLVWGLWGERFEALWRWHHAMKENRLPVDWDMYTYPLWPREFGGDTWESGSGHLQFAEPRPPREIRRSEEQMQTLRRALYSNKFRGRQLGEASLQKLLNFQLDFCEGETQ